MPVCKECGQENPEIARFCLACGTRFAEADPPAPPQEERKLVTVLFTDIVGSTARAEELDPEDVRARLRPYYERVRAELERFGGTVEKFIGDAVVALFGAPVAHEDDPERAVRAAFAVRDAVAELNAEDGWLDLRLRTAVHTGEALVVTGARPSEGEAMAAGDVMNTAARLQSAAPVDAIVVGELTYRSTRDVIAYRDAEPVAAKGKSEPVPVWEAVAPLDDAAREQEEQRPLVGRSEELRALKQLWRDVVRERRPSVAAVLGPPGIGKTRLVDALAAEAMVDGCVRRGRCTSYGEGLTYWPIAEVLRSAAGILRSDDAVTVARKLGELLEALPVDETAELRTLAAAAANTLGIAASPHGTYATAEISQGELHWGLRRLLNLLARRRPMLVVLEDLHWAEPTLLELVETLLEPDEDVPLLVVASARPELREAAPPLVVPGPRRLVLELAPLPAEEGERLLGQLLGSAALAADPAAAAVLTRAAGNPLFLEETVRMLRESGVVDPSGWRLDGDGAELPVPTSLQGLVASRLDALPQAEKQVALHASVVGLVFWPGAVAHIRGGDGGAGDVHARLQGLERRDVVHAHPTSTLAGEREFAFKHVLLRDVAYGELPKGRRAELHLRLADWIEALPTAGDELVEIVAYHLEQSCRMAEEVARSPVAPPRARAAAALLRAGETAERREGYREAERWYLRGLELLGHAEPATRVELLLRHARPLAALGRLPEALEAAARAAAEARALLRDDLRASALIFAANVDLRQGRASDARSALDEALELALRCGDRRLQVRGWFAAAALSGEFEGDVEHGRELLRAALVVAEEIGDRVLSVEGHLRLGFLLYNGGDLAGAEEAFAECIARAGELGSRRDETRALFNLGLIKYFRGDTAEAERLGAEARSALQVTGETYFQMQNAAALALYALGRGEPQLAEERLREALPLALEEDGWLLVELYRLLVAALVARGRIDEAAELVAFAARRVPEEHSYARAALLLARAYVAAARGRSEGLTLYEDALELLDSLNLPLEASQARMAYAEALEAMGDVAAAQWQLEQAHAVCERVGASGLCAQIAARFTVEAAGPVVPVPPPATA